MHDLSALGFGPFFQEQFARFEDLVPARITAEHRGGFEVCSQASTGLARLSGQLRHHDESAAVGDWVALHEQPGPDNVVIVERICERRTVFTRGAAGRPARAQVVAANVDQVFVVCGLDTDFSVHRIERYLARIWSSGATPAVILNKSDLCSRDGGAGLCPAERERGKVWKPSEGFHINDLPAAIGEVERRAPGVRIFATRAAAGEGLDAIAKTIEPGTTAAFVGSSGAGKSTLINALVGDDVMATAETRASDGCGRHTTCHRQLVLLPQGGLVLDTPGMRELQLADEEGLDRVFDDIEALAVHCHFRDCTHAHEPGCAVNQAVLTGALDGDRLEHFRALAREARAYERRHDEHLRRQSGRVWGQLHAEVARLRRWKEGG